MRKEYDSPLPREELIASLRKKTVPYRLFRLGLYDWELKEYEDGTFRVTNDAFYGGQKSRTILRFEEIEYGTHIFVEYDEDRPSFVLVMFFLVAILILTVDAIYKLGIKGLVILPVGIGLFLISFLIDRFYVKKSIEWFETDVLGIEKQ